MGKIARMADRPRKALILARGGRLSPPERQILERFEQALPRGAQLQIWSELEIFDSGGAAQQIDVVALGHYGLYAVEVKHLAGGVIGDERARSIEAMRRQHVVDATLARARENARRLQDLLLQELGGEALPVESLVLVPNGDLKMALPEATCRHVVTASELLHALISGELPGDTAPPARVPVEAPTAQAVASLLGGLRWRPRPGRGSFQQELSVLQRDIVADLTEAVAGGRTSMEVRGDDLRYRIEESAAAWVIACVFVRSLEEHGYIERQLTGKAAEERRRAFLTGRSSITPRDYLMQLLQVIGQYPACEPILGRENRSLWDIAPSDEGASSLLSFLSRKDQIRDRLDLARTGLWGDLFQSISEPLLKANAMIPTPSIVEDFLLDRTVNQAAAEFGVSAVRVLDPACGSGTLLAGAFQRLLAGDPRSAGGHHALDVLDQLHGVDISSAATMITRIRLLLEYCKATGCEHISSVPALPLHVVTADSLLPQPATSSDLPPDRTGASSPKPVLSRRYTVVVCAPPLITPRDPARRDAYRERYRSAAGKFPLFVPFVERCFELAERDGLVGLIVGNSFMKRQFGKPLVEEVLPAVELTHIVDTSGAYIPGYGVPTVILLGRNRLPKSEVIRVAAGRRGEPITPMRPAEGRVWSSIVAHLDQSGYEDDYIVVSDVRREQLVTHPWSLGAGDEVTLRGVLERDGVPLRDLAATVRMGAWSGRDEVFVLPRHVAERLGLEPEVLRPLVRGEAVRDFSFSTEEVALVPPAHDLQRSAGPHPRWRAWLQRYRPLFVNRLHRGTDAPEAWWAWSRPPRISEARTRIIGPVISRNNHFVFARGDLVASRTVLAIEPGESSSEIALYSWLAFLNSSTASFWMKQFAHVRGDVHGGIRMEELLHDFSNATDRLLIPRQILEPGTVRDQMVTLARQLECTARELEVTAPERVIERWDRSSRGSLIESLADAQLRERTLLRRMVCEQEDLDWLVYEAIGMTSGELQIPKATASPEQRPFAWLTDEPPVGLDRRLAETWRRRRKAGQARGPLKVLEAAPYKRAFRDIGDDREIDHDELREEAEGALPVRARREGTDYERRTELACERWLLDRMEEVFRDAPARCASVAELASRFSALAGVPTVVALLSRERGELSSGVLERRVGELLSGHAVPYLAALRHTERGLEKRAQWEAAWELLRRQDPGEPMVSIPIPPFYDQADYRDATTFLHRGKLDVATERFIAYPGEGDRETRYGWAGWTPVQQAEMLVALVEQCRDRDEGRAAGPLTPLLAGISELVLWMPAWDGAVPTSGSAAEIFHLRVQNEARRLGLDAMALRAWRPANRKQVRGSHRA